MPADLLHSILSNTGSVLLIILFFGGSIFVHELGHFLAARARGLRVETFSIGFGPPIVSWTSAKSGTRYMVAWFPLGGYVLLPQIADLGALEGEAKVSAEELPSVSYLSKVIVLLAGAAFNVLFAFILACVVWRTGILEATEANSTLIGYVAPTIDLPNGAKVQSPALAAGLRVGDVVKAIDGHPTADWPALNETLVMGSAHDAQGGRISVFTIDRGGHEMKVTLHPILSGDDKVRRVGIGTGYEMNVDSVAPGSALAKSGLLPGDRITGLNGALVLNFQTIADQLESDPSRPASLTVLRGHTTLHLAIPPRTASLPLGQAAFAAAIHLAHPSPVQQVGQDFLLTIRTVWALINPHSDIGLSKLSGPVGIVREFHAAVEVGIMAVLRFTVFINVNLAILNLLPIPVLDGGQIAFATIGRLRGRALPPRFIIAVHSLFTVLILSVFVYVSFFDVRRWSREGDEAKAAAAAPVSQKH
ncbi:MAG TPA: RIP metalloprotease RseP [Opitutaceae bacterium]